MDLLQRSKHLLHHYKILPKKRFGQNFAVDKALLRKLISYASLTKDDVVLEVGAGLGFITELLSEKCKQVVAVEIDPKLMKILREQLQGLRNVELIEGDVLSAFIPPFNKVVSIPPYYISSPLVFWLLERRFDCAVLTFQEEFAERLVAAVGSKGYGRLTVNVYYRATMELLDRVSRETFYPPPDVDSVVVRLKPKEPPFRVEDEEAFFELVQILFSQRNRKVRNAIVPLLRKRGVGAERDRRLTDSIPFHDKRVRELAPEDFGALTNELVKEKGFLQ